MEKAKSGIILQARLDSSRLPGKALLPLGGRPLILRVMQALNRIPAEVRVLACPGDSAEAFGPLAGEAGFELFAGPKDDVLKRYCLAAQSFGMDRVIRATGDNPFVFADAAAAIAAIATELGADYAGYDGLPHGGGVEAVSTEALLRAERETDAPSDREHVCPYLYGHPELFLLHRPAPPGKWLGPDIRLTVDTQEDYERAQTLYDALGTGDDGRYCGAAIIDTYNRVFRGSSDHRSSDLRSGGEHPA